MYILKNNQLSVAILDPQTDLDRCGSRYCVGGYIYQVTDNIKGELFSGPQYPAPYPDVFDGQGAPDMFLANLHGDTAPVGGEVGIIGVGRVRRTSTKTPFSVRDNPEVIEFLPWRVTQGPNSILMETEQTFAEWSYHLSRLVTLMGRAVYSRTEIRNVGQPVLPVRWFAHPFFPLTEDRVYCQFSTPVSMAENPGYGVNAQGFIQQKSDFNWKAGHFQWLQYEKTGNSMTIIERHPTIGAVTTVTDFMPDPLPVWSNDRTFSFEPYLARQLATGEAAAWSIEYRF
ncbi:hypothetical protein BH10CHL1_BH10CHL1_47690 [soil metagenome]